MIDLINFLTVPSAIFGLQNFGSSLIVSQQLINLLNATLCFCKRHFVSSNSYFFQL